MFLQLLREGMSIRAIERTTGSSKNTIIKRLNEAGAALGAYQDQAFCNLPCKRVQVDDPGLRQAKERRGCQVGSRGRWRYADLDGDLRRYQAGVLGSRRWGSRLRAA